MARITHTCGHEQDHYIIAEYAADCDRQAARLARRKCSPCMDIAARLAESEQRAAVAGLTLIALEGSAKQIAWAETIRAKRFMALQRKDQDAAQRIARVTAAKWWIEQRSESDAVLIQLVANDISGN